MNNNYEIECPVCDIITLVEVKYDEERPAHCPMCGEDVEPESIEAEED